MSWSIYVSGKKSAVIDYVKKTLDSQDHLTAQQICQRIQAIPDPTSIDEYGRPTPWDSATHVRVSGAGHGGAISAAGINGGPGGLIIEPYVPIELIQGVQEAEQAAVQQEIRQPAPDLEAQQQQQQQQ